LIIAVQHSNFPKELAYLLGSVPQLRFFIDVRNSSIAEDKYKRLINY